MTDMNQDLADRLETIQSEGLYRELREIASAQGPRIRLGETELLNFSSNDYLGLANEPSLVEAAIRAAERYGVGAGASRLICGSLDIHHELEAALASWQMAEASLLFSSGYAAAMGTLTSVVEAGDVILIDKRVHACLVDAARLSPAKLRVFRHNDLADLEAKLAWAADQHAGHRILVVTESVFSMDGDLAPLREMAALKARYGAWLMVDEAHAAGLFGEHRQGLVDAFEVRDAIEIRLGTLGKAVGASGGYICGSRELIDFLVNRARPFIFSTAPSPMVAAAALAGIRIIRGQEGETRRTRLWLSLDYLKNEFIRHVGPLPAVRSAIIPIMLGEASVALRTAEQLRHEGILLPAIRYPTVPRGSARLRLTLSAAHEVRDLDRLVSVLGALKPGMVELT